MEKSCETNNQQELRREQEIKNNCHQQIKIINTTKRKTGQNTDGN
jgi:hypothetical protein